MIKKRIWIGFLLVTLLVGAVPVFSLAEPITSPPAQEGTNLLKNPSFEGINCAPGSAPGWCDDNWSRDTHNGSFHDNIFTPQGWVTWWREGGGYGQPEVKTIPKVAPFIGPPARVYDGNYSALLFTFWRNQDAGFYQKVTGLEPGATVQFSAYAHGWSCDQDGDPYTCGDQWNQRFQVGIEPNGVADPFAPSIAWSAEQRAPDEFTLIGPVTAQVGASGSVVVFLRSITKWPYKHLDAYWDKASLVMTSPGTPPTNTPPPAPPTSTPGPPPTPRNTPTPRPDGAIVHIVESGDTIFGIALEYGVTAEQIRELNAGSIGAGDIIAVGQELVITLPTQTLTPSPMPAPPTAEPTATPAAAEETEGSSTSLGSGTASVCVLAYHDRNGDTFHNPDTEELLPNVEIAVADASGVLARYTTDGISEPYCFTGMNAGSYRVIQTPPPGYKASGPAEWPAALSEGAQIDLQFGNARDEDAATTAEETEAATEENPDEEGGGGGGGLSFKNITQTLAKIGGIMILVLALGVGILFVLTRRRM
jgi:LysM repeat protein